MGIVGCVAGVVELPYAARPRHPARSYGRACMLAVRARGDLRGDVPAGHPLAPPVESSQPIVTDDPDRHETVYADPSYRPASRFRRRWHALTDRRRICSQALQDIDDSCARCRRDELVLGQHFAIGEEGCCPMRGDLHGLGLGGVRVRGGLTDNSGCLSRTGMRCQSRS